MQTQSSLRVPIKSHIYMCYIFDFYFGIASHLIPRVRNHFLKLKDFFDFEQIILMTVDNVDYTLILGGSNIRHVPLLPVRIPKHVMWILGQLFGVVELLRASRNREKMVLFASPYAMYSIVISWLLRIPLIVHFKYDQTTQPTISPLQRGILNAMINFALRRADMVIATTPTLKKIAIYRGVSEKKIFVSPNYVDEDVFSPNVDGKWVRELLQVAQDEKLIIYMGRLSPEKGLDTLLDAISIVFNRYPRLKFKLLIIGSGPKKDRLIKKCKEQSLCEKVLFMNPVPHSKVPSFLSACDIAILPSYSEGNPKFLLEAMMMGKPIIATNVIGIREAVTNGKEALLIDPGNPEMLASAIITLLENQELALVLGAHAREKALRKYSKKVVFKQAIRNPFLVLGF
ncbi:MAG: glycosyltransferase family 4 protein [Desulfurococcaceae archaeon]|nr:glycosyltransferase family 4 protein [Desulfurococcaceae archaeon]